MKGDEVFYETPAGIMAADVTTTPDFSIERRSLVWQRKWDFVLGDTFDRNWDVSRDGQRFVFVGTTELSTQLNVVLNWHEELERLVPTNR